MIEKIFNKLNKIPSWVGVVALLLACVVQAIPSVINFDGVIDALNSYMKDLSGSTLQINATPGFKYLAGALNAVIAWLVIEGVAQLVYGWALRYRYTNRGKKFYLTSVRYSMAVVQLIFGLYSLLSVWVPNVYGYSADAVLFLLRTGVITLTFMGIRKECVNDKFVFLLYNRLYAVYFIYNGALWLLEFFGALLSSELDVGYVIYSAVMVVIIALSAVALYFTVYKKLKKEQEEARKIIILPPTSGGDGEIFRGYGM